MAPPLIVAVLPLSSDRAVVGMRTNPPLLRRVGRITAVTLAVAAVTMMVTAVL